MLQCINVKLKLKFAIELQEVYLRGTIYLRTPLFGMFMVVTLFVVRAGPVVLPICGATRNLMFTQYAHRRI